MFQNLINSGIPVLESFSYVLARAFSLIHTVLEASQVDITREDEIDQSIVDAFEKIRQNRGSRTDPVIVPWSSGQVSKALDILQFRSRHSHAEHHLSCRNRWHRLAYND